MKKLVPVLFPLLVTSYAFAASEPPNTSQIPSAAISKCQANADSNERLQCYDTLLPPAKAETQTGDVGKWQVTTEQSPVDDSENVTLVLQADKSINTQFGESIYPTLVISCTEKKSSLYINWNQYLGLNQTTILHRIDKKKALKNAWNNSTDNEAAFYPSSKVIPLVKELSGAQKLYSQVTPYNSNPVEAIFSLNGLSEAMKPLQKACKWQ